MMDIYHILTKLPHRYPFLLVDRVLDIDLHVDPRQEFAPRIKSRVDAQGKFVTPALDDMHPFLDPAKLAQLRCEALAIRSSP